MPSMSEQVDFHVEIGRGLTLRSPVMVASGTFGYGFDVPLVDRSVLGAIVTKGTTAKPRQGNPPTRIAETASGMLNAIGLQNPGVEHVAREYAPAWSSWDLPVIVNVAGDSVAEYVAVAKRLDGVRGVAGLELNVSCPNVANGLQFGVDARLAQELTSAVRAITELPLIVKLTPNVTDIVEIALSVERAGADAISAINTYVGMSIDVRARRPVLASISGGLSGPAIKPLALQAVWEVAAAVRIPVVGIGGITTAEDALEFLLAGAVAVQLGTINYVRPQAAHEVCDGIEAYLRDRGMNDLRDVPIRARAVGMHA
jgi:dihydroorotate dehydrogenase (NAD+) catalytic subunit